MINLNRRELKVILRGLTLERELLRDELISDPEWRGRIMDDPEYIELVLLQDKLIDELEKSPY